MFFANQAERLVKYPPVVRAFVATASEATELLPTQKKLVPPEATP